MRGPVVVAALLLAAVLPSQRTVLVGGKIWTGTGKPADATAIVVDGERILYVGSDDEATRRAGAGSKRIDLAGHRVVPGFTDAHVHFLGGGEELLAPDLRSADSEEEFARRLGEAAKAVPAGTWLTAGSWDHERWPGAHLPTRAVLDRYVPDNPVFVQRLDGHMAVANSRAIAIAKVTADTPDPPGGTIVRDPNTGEPAGVFKDEAMALISSHVPPWTDEQRLRYARAALRHAAELGVTSVHHMSSSPGALETYQQLRAAGQLTCRIVVYPLMPSYRHWRAVGVRRGFGDAWLEVNGMKAFADGSLGSTTAWFFEPYDDAPDTSGLPMPEMLAGGSMPDDVAACFDCGLQVAVHAIGDRANHAMLDIFEHAGGDRLRALRARIEHAQHLLPDDVPRFGALGVIASMQPYHCADDGRWAEKRIGTERCKTTYAFRSLLDSGAVLAFGSDWPVAPLSPMLGIDAAVTRRTLDGKHPDGWVPEQKITVEEALRAYTFGGAFAAFEEDRRGTLEPGKLADLVVLDRDPLAIDPHALRDVRVTITMVGGRVVFTR